MLKEEISLNSLNWLELDTHVFIGNKRHKPMRKKCLFLQTSSTYINVYIYI